MVYEHFGSAPYFIVVNAETKAVETLNNKDLNHQLNFALFIIMQCLMTKP
ncbi:MAG TPA: hypothetical protein HPP56_06965 [Nitrospirae bacterium]|nr:hypothetical protein [Nitrospirota bacterium]